MRLRQLMTPPLLTASADQPVGQVIHTMNELRARANPGGRWQNKRGWMLIR